ncbi:MAG: GNAT family N-acetyltransferase [Rhizobiales bacterium]|nr:GNAT family N-acetyltransferase [Hyphomicrobiales bacterium]
MASAVPSYEVRVAAAGDAAAIARLNRDVQALHVANCGWLFKPGGLASAEIVDLIQKPGVIMLVALDGDQVEGYLFAELMELPETTLTRSYKALLVHHLAVAANKRRRGMASALAAPLAGHARRLGATMITANVWSFNRASIAFFEGLGFTRYVDRLWRQVDAPTPT